MLNTFTSLKCSKKCFHNVQKPTNMLYLFVEFRCQLLNMKTLFYFKSRIAEFISETENRLRRETHHKTENASNVNPVCDEFPVSIYPSNFPRQTVKKVGRETCHAMKIRPKFLLEVKIATEFLCGPRI